MNSINYEEDSEDIDFPPVIYSKDLKDEPPRRKKKNCLNKFLRLFKSKRSLLYLIIGIVLVIIIIVIIVIIELTKRKKDKENNDNNNYDNNSEYKTKENIWKGGYIIARYKNIDDNNNIINVDKEKNGLDKEDCTTEEIEDGNSIIKNLEDDTFSIITTEIIIDSTDNFESKEYRKFNITFKNKIKSMKEMFKDITELISIDLSYLKTDEITNLDSTFLNCIFLENITFDNFNSKKLTSMKSTFENCSSLEKLDLSSFDKPPLQTMEKAFKNCKNLTEINLINFDLNENMNFNETFDFMEDGNFTIINNKNNKTSNEKTIYINITCNEDFKNYLNNQCNHAPPKYLCQMCYVKDSPPLYISTFLTTYFSNPAITSLPTD